MYQLNPSRGVYARGKSTTYENTVAVLAKSRIQDWYITAGFALAKPGDVLLIKMGGRIPRGIIALGLITKLWRDRNDSRMMEFCTEARATEALLEWPIPAQWMKTHLKHQQANLVDLSASSELLLQELARRGIRLERRPLRGTRVLTSGRLSAEEVVGPLSGSMDEEGRRLLRLHVVYERSPKNRTLVLAERKDRDCEVCGFSFGARFGFAFKDYIEVHHKKPVAQGQRIPSPKEFALLCSNCHAVAHWMAGPKPRSPAELKRLLRSQSTSRRQDAT
jgi:hypothetical protein